MGFKRFSILIIIRVLLILFTLWGLISLYLMSEYPTAMLLIIVLLVSQVFELYRFVAKTNQELSRFLESARYADFSQHFELSGVGAGFEELGQAFSDILKRFQNTRSAQEKDLKYLKAMVEHIPVPLITIQQNEHIQLLNNSARRLFANHHINKLSDLGKFGADLSIQLTEISPGQRRLVNLEMDGMTWQLMMSSTDVIIENQREKLVSLQDIQSELDSAQLRAWQDLVRVLTHELMNSITPVASLANTATDLMTELQCKLPNNNGCEEDLEDIVNAIATVARRSDGLMAFINSYRQLTRLPSPDKKHIKVADVVNNALDIAGYNWSEIGIVIEKQITPSALEVQVDKNMIEQVLINLLKNSAQAMTDVKAPVITVESRLNSRGHVVIEISDNGPGVPQDIQDRIFVPFYTTKRDGSGVGLAFSRHVLIAHGGNLKLDTSYSDGAKFILTF